MRAHYSPYRWHDDFLLYHQKETFILQPKFVLFQWARTMTNFQPLSAPPPRDLLTSPPRPAPAESQTNLSCTHEGREYSAGEKWQSNLCTSCECKDGLTFCQSTECPPVAHCAKTTHDSDQCCPRCVGECGGRWTGSQGGGQSHRAMDRVTGGWKGSQGNGQGHRGMDMVTGRWTGHRAMDRVTGEWIGSQGDGQGHRRMDGVTGEWTGSQGDGQGHRGMDRGDGQVTGRWTGSQGDG